MSEKETIFTIEELKKRVAPIAERYGLPCVYLFGSYARNEAGRDSDIDILIDRNGSVIKSLFDMGALYNDLALSLGKEIDLIALDALQQEDVKRRTPHFMDIMNAERVILYERQ